MTESQRDNAYCEIGYQELTVLINKIQDPDEFEFYEQICEIHEKFKTCHMEHIVNYFNILVNVLRKKPESAYLTQITKVRDELKKWILAERKVGATKIELYNLSEIKPLASRQSDLSLEDGVDLEDDIQIELT